MEIPSGTTVGDRPREYDDDWNLGWGLHIEFLCLVILTRFFLFYFFLAFFFLFHATHR